MSESSDEYKRQLEDLLQRSYMMDGDVEEIALLEEAIRLVDAHNDIERGFQLRVNLIQAATFNGFPEKLLVAFSWCLAQCDRAPDLGGGRTFDEGRLLWQSKWAMHVLPDFPHISRQKFDEVTRDMGERYQKFGAGLRPIHKLRCTAAIDFRDKEEAEREFPLWLSSKKDWNSDCKACDADSQVDYWLFHDEPEKALKAAAPILSGKLRCAEVPHVTYGFVVNALTRLGRIDEAAEMHLRGYKLVAGNRELIRTVARHLEFLVRTDNRVRAVGVFQKHLGMALDSSPLRRWSFLYASLYLFEHLKAVSRSDVRRMRLAPAFPLHREDGEYSVTEIADWLRARCNELADAFDRRNGNRAFHQDIEAIPKMLAEVAPHPLSSK